MSLERLLTLWDLSSDNSVDERVIRSLAGQCQSQLAPDNPVSITARSTVGSADEHRSGCANVTKHCFSCGHANTFTQHWCYECGCSLLTASRDSVNCRGSHGSFANTTTTTRSEPKSSHVTTTNPVPPPMPVRSSRRPLYSSVKRTWSKASFYMWRKPSSLNTNTRNYSKPQAHSNTPSTSGPSSSHSLPAQKEDIVSHSCDKVVLTLLHLPNEVIIKILSSLLLRDLYSCMLVCKRLCHLATDPTLWKVIHLQGKISEDSLLSVTRRQPSALSLISCTGRLGVRVVTQAFNMCGRRLQSLTVDTCSCGPSSVDMLLILCSQCCPGLSRLAVSWSTLSDLTILHLAVHCHNLHSLSLLHVSGVSSNAIRTLTTSQKHSLRVLRLYLHPQPVITDLLPEEPLPQVTEYGFYCGPSSPITADALQHLYSSLPNLITMTIYCIELTKGAEELLFCHKRVPIINVIMNLQTTI